MVLAAGSVADILVESEAHILHEMLPVCLENQLPPPACVMSRGLQGPKYAVTIPQPAVVALNTLDMRRPAGKALKDAAARGYDAVAATEPVVARHALAILLSQVPSLPLLPRS